MIIKTLEPLSEINLKKIEDATGIKPEYVSRENISDETLGCADVIITRDRDFKSEVLEKCHNLKFLFVVSAGVEKLPFDLLKEKNVDLVYCDANQIDEKGNILHESYLRYKNMPIINEKNNSKKEILAFSRHIAIGCSQIFTKEVKEKLIPFTPSTMAHDWNTVYIASKMKGIYCLDKPLFGYRLHGNNAFGGRNFKQNVHIWKQKEGNNYKSYLKYRHHAITDTYLAGVLMCEEYSKRIEKNNLKKQENEVIKYFKNAQKHKMIYLPIHKYFKYLSFKGIQKRAIKEIMILHFPLIGYIIFSLI